MKTINISGVPFPVSQICMGTAMFGGPKIPKDVAFEKLKLMNEIKDKYS